jgi:cell wall-associated NlpC family hydrolase
MNARETRERRAVVAEALTWLGTPYHHLGDVKGAGVDCAMLLVRVYADLGLIPDFDPRPYPTDWHLHRSEERYLGHVLAHAREVARPRPGDLALWRYGRCFSHSAIVIRWPRVLHAFVREGCVLADGEKAPFAGRAVKYFSLWTEEECQS